MTDPIPTEQRNEASAELVKALLILNGGGAVALLVFLQAVWEKSLAIVIPTIHGIIILAVGASFAALFHLIRIHTSWATQKGKSEKAERLRKTYYAVAYISLAAFLGGVIYLGFKFLTAKIG